MKNSKPLLFIIAMTVIHASLFAQREHDEMQKLITTVECNYSGFRMLNADQQQSYFNAKKNALDSIDARSTVNEQLRVIKTYLSFFKNNHLCAFTGDFMSFATGEIGFKLDPPTLSIADSSTIILTIPSFLGQNKTRIDELLKTNQTQLSCKKNLIIDIRGNRGGTDEAFYPLLPLLSTNTMTVHAFYVLVNENSLKKYVKYLSAEKIEKLKKRSGELASLSNDTSDITIDNQHYPVSAYPVNVAIIVDRYVGSSAEQFLLYAKQSRKVKIFGENTHGMLDCTNPDMYQFFNNAITVTIPMTISSRVWSRAAIENIGIQPDIYVPDMTKVIEFTKSTLKNW
jgi:hypothetical protein